ncbi:hypothetical protein SRHO_G00139510 [Serrasalmus rhombeus]
MPCELSELNWLLWVELNLILLLESLSEEAAPCGFCTVTCFGALDWIIGPFGDHCVSTLRGQSWFDSADLSCCVDSFRILDARTCRNAGGDHLDLKPQQLGLVDFSWSFLDVCRRAERLL